ncbi:MAG: hypothetical protein ACYC3H_00105 [Bellilinea sp.]
MNKRILELGIRPEQLQKLNGVVLQENFRNRIDEVSRVNVTLTQKPILDDIDIPDILSSNHDLIDVIEPINRIDLDPKIGDELSKKVAFCGYDESNYKFLTLEGVAHITTHSLVTYAQNDLYPINMLTFYFYTRSNTIINISKYIKYSQDPESDSNRDYAEDRSNFIETYALNNTILFIDGPIIGGNISSYTNALVDNLHKKNVIPIFFVKNSNSSLVVDNIQALKSDFNSDLHWSYQFLKQGQRSNLFVYTDKYNASNSKLFCYIKPFNSVTTQRIEFRPDTYKMYQDAFGGIFNLIYYLMMVHGDKSNPQIRPIAIAEKYARETMHLINSDTLLKSSGLIQTLDQTRFGG